MTKKECFNERLGDKSPNRSPVSVRNGERSKTKRPWDFLVKTSRKLVGELNEFDGDYFEFYLRKKAELSKRERKVLKNNKKEDRKCFQRKF